MKERFATLDIGTNTILMLIAEKSDSSNSFTEIRDEHEIARLGEGFSNNTKKIILPSAIERASNILDRYKKIYQEMNVNEVYAVGTSALREAQNGIEVTKILSSILNKPIELIPGENEAEFSFRGAVNDDTPSLVIDIGGGSTEIISGEQGNILKRLSIPVGAVKLTESHFKDNFSSSKRLEIAKGFIEDLFKDINFNSNNFKVYAVAGTPTTLAAVDLGLADFERTKIEGYRLQIQKIENILESFNSMSVQEIINKFKIHPNRADVITAGTLILIQVLKSIGSEYCIASTKGIRYGMMKYLINKVS